MASESSPRHMSLIPYSASREIVLQQGGAIVIYDNQSKSLSVRHDNDLSRDESECPYCHRPYQEKYSNNDQNAYAEQAQTPRDRSFVDPEYFRMLAQSQRPSPAESAASTPLGTFAQYIPRALRSGRSRDVSGSQIPSDAEFVASEPNPSSDHKAGQGISSSAFSPGYFKQLFREERELGRGGNGVVVLVEHVLDGFSLGHFACKRIPVGNDHRWLEKVLVEVKLLTQVSHVNLVKYHWVWVEEFQPSTFAPSVPCVWILQQYCNGGDLHRYVIGPKDDNTSAESQKARHRRRSKGKLTPADSMHRQSKLTLEEIFSFFKDITSGLHHLHSKGYIHRDVKPSNCLLLNDQGRTRVLLSDFGEVQVAGTLRGNTGATGTISFCAPEVLQMNVSDGRLGDFTTKSDIFSLGMIVYFMCFGHLPYANAAEDEDEDDEDIDLLREEITGWQGFDDLTKIRPDLPDRLYKYLQRLLSVDPNERPSTEAILTSIKASSSLGDSPPIGPNAVPRVTPLETPARSRNKSASRQRAESELPPLARKLSTAMLEKPLSPITRSKTMSSADDLDRLSSRPQSPRMLLPPPSSPSGMRRVLREAQNLSWATLMRYATLLVKIAVLTSACTPLAPRPTVTYPLLILAVLEASLSSTSVLFGLTSLSTYLLIVWTLRRQSIMCDIPSISRLDDLMR